LLTALGALLLVPAAQAFANAPVTINIQGSGSGEVEGYDREEGEPTLLPGIPQVDCSYTSPGPATGACNVEASTAFEAFEGIFVVAYPAAESELVAFESTISASGETLGACAAENSFCSAFAEEGEVEEIEISALFCLEGQSEAECLGGGGPTNRRTLTLTKSPAPNAGTGTGSVTSKPKGVKCGAACDKAVASMYKGTPVVLTEKPSTGSTFVEWTGACSGSSPTCTVPMSEDEEVGAVFTGTSKAFSPAEALTVSKGESSGYGTVKGSGGLGCEAECSSTTVLYQGPITEPKPKPGKTVALTQAPAFGSEFSGWSGCDSITEAGECLVTMETAKAVTAEYTALPNFDLTVEKSSYEGGAGSVSSKPKGIYCGGTCTSAVASMPEGASVVLTEKPGKETTFTGWEGGGCSGTAPTCTVTMSAAQTVTAKFSGPVKTINPAETLTLSKAGSGYGTVKASGLKCEVLCTSTGVIYQGPITEPKPKPGKVVTLSAVSAPGSGPVSWSGCDSVTEAGECIVAMETSKGVTATFEELE